MNPYTTSSYTVSLTGGAYTVSTSSSQPQWSQSMHNSAPTDNTVTFTKEEFTKMLGHMVILIPPIGLDMDNPAIQGAFKDWQSAIQQLQIAHKNLELIANLAQDHE